MSDIHTYNYVETGDNLNAGLDIVMFPPPGTDVPVGYVGIATLNLAVVVDKNIDCSVAPRASDNTYQPNCYVYVKKGSTIKAQIVALYREKNQGTGIANTWSTYFSKITIGHGETICLYVPDSTGMGPSSIWQAREEFLSYTLTGIITSADIADPIV